MKDEDMPVLRRLIDDEDGQDLIEYALLTGAIGMCAFVAFSLWSASINGTYKTLNTTTNGLWDPELKK
jgi:Flp pilus assembly pilin Flp